MFNLVNFFFISSWALSEANRLNVELNDWTEPISTKLNWFYCMIYEIEMTEYELEVHDEGGVDPWYGCEWFKVDPRLGYNNKNNITSLKNVKENNMKKVIQN